METVFELSNLLVAPFWLLMIFLPGWRVTERLMRTPVASVAPALVYAALMLPRVSAHAPVLLRPELDAVARLLGSHEGATLAWAHFLAFDLLVGRWIYRDARRRRISAWLSSPALFLTLLLGPVGFLLHLCLRALLGRDAPARDDAPAGDASAG